MLVPGSYDISAVCGDTFVQRFRFVLNDDYMILYTVDPKIQIKNSNDEVITEFTLAPPGTSRVGVHALQVLSDDILLWEMSTDDTNSIVPGTYKYSLELLFGTMRATMVTGNINFTVEGV